MSVKLVNDETFTLEDLRSWDRPGIWLAVLGHPIKHSLSPHMHNAALEELAKSDASYEQWQYTRFDIPVENLEEALGLLHEKRFRGVNLTIPHKVEALKYVADMDPDAAAIGAINTLFWKDSGYYGYNTDGYGVETAIARNLNVSLLDKPVVLLGAGGAGRAAAVQCLSRDCQALWIGNRSSARLDALVQDIRKLYPKAEIYPFLFESDPQLPESALIINATSTGLKAEDRLPMDMSGFAPDSVFFDMIYNPPETIMMRALKAQGVAACNGLDMLVYQGARALEIWTGRDQVPEKAMRSAALGGKS
ncbi:MAG: shikimate dehydrogenase [Opitutales bacterium]